MIGKNILHYKILEKLGEGGMGVVYLAEDTKLKRQVAIKFLPKHIAANSDERKRFQIEAQAAASLNHPNISHIYAIEEADDDIFIVMEYIDGVELKEKIVNNQLSIDTVIKYTTQIAEGLRAAHDKGITHRDVKSSNIMVTEDGKIKIMDFGLAKIGTGLQLTKEHSTLGTAAYMSPEQINGEEVDHRTDIWSFGVILYEMLTGKFPFKGDYEQAIMYSIVHENFTPFPESNLEVPNFLLNIIDKSLQKSIDNRYQSVSEILTDLKTKIESETSDTKEIPAVTLRNSKSQRQKVTYIFSGIIIITVLITILFGGLSTFKSWFNYIQIPDEQHLMVLPIINIGGNDNDQALCDGLIETLTSKLSQLEKYHGSLWVVPSSEVVRNNINSASEAHRMFEVNLAVSGSLQIINDIYRLTINLIDAENLKQLNSSVIDMNKTNVTGLQEQSVIKLVNMLNLRLNPETEKALQSGRSTVPGSYEFYLQGRGYLQRYENEANLNLAIDLFKSAIARDSLFVLARAGLAEAYWRKYEYLKNPIWADKAHFEGENAFELNNTLAQVNITLGMIHAGTGQYEDAVKSFKLALNVEPTNSDAYRGLAKAYESQNLLDEAEITYKKAISLKPDYWAGYNSLGAFYYKHARYEEAVSQFIQVIKLTPDNKKGYNNLGGVYYALKRWKEAREMFEKSLALKKSYSVSSNLGTLYFIEGDYENATKMYELALSLNDHDYRIWGNLASACQWIPGKREQAVENYKIAIKKARESNKINPNDVYTIASLAGYYASIGNVREAKILIEKALNMAPDDLEIIYQAGTTFELLGERETALHWLGKAIEGGYSYAEIVNQPELKDLLKDESFNALLKQRKLK